MIYIGPHDVSFLFTDEKTDVDDDTFFQKQSGRLLYLILLLGQDEEIRQPRNSSRPKYTTVWKKYGYLYLQIENCKNN